MMVPPPPAIATNGSFPVVGIGASAGGLEAFSQLLRALPIDSGAALVLVQHLSARHPSALSEILSRTTTMQVSEAQDDVAVQPNQVYVIPPGKAMTIAGGYLSVQPRRGGTGLHHPIDEFFASLAADQRECAIGVILSGTATDGTLGLKEIKAAGGVSFAQDASAQQDGMPSSAIASGCVDFVLPPEKIAQEIARIAKHQYVVSTPASTDMQPKPPEPEQDEEDEADLGDILRLLHDAKDVDFSQYKQTTLQRRIARRMLLHDMQTVQQYQQLLEGNAAEVEALFQDILIGVTGFFRDPAIFDALKANVLPKLFTDRSRHEPLRIWVLGCSTGEEAYSYGIALAEFAEAIHKPLPVQIFATDLNATAINTARAGIYPKSIGEQVSEARLRRYFTEIEGSYRVSKSIRDICVFAPHNVLSDPPFSRLDIISCRNLLIYLDSTLQRRVLPLLHYALQPTGVLVLGGSETIAAYRGLFQPLDAKHRIFSRLPRPATHGLTELRDATRRSGADWPTRAKSVRPPSIVQKEADRIIASRFAPPGVVIDANMEIVQFHGDTAPWLAPPKGKPSLNLMKMLREGLVPALPAAIAKARRDGASGRVEQLRVRSAGGWRETAVEIIPVRGEGENDAAFLILFQDAAGTLAQAQRSARLGANPADPVPNDGVSSGQLMQELTAMREYVQTVIEQQETANEELQSANEEAQSANEELQSVNEELETSKEELQASNEELVTVNAELQHRNQELDRAREFAQSVTESVRDPLLVLDSKLRVQSASRSFYQTFRVRPGETLHRHFCDLGTGEWKVPALNSALEDVVLRDKAFDGFEVRNDFAELGRRIMLLNARRVRPEPGRQLLVLVSIEDITDRYALQESQQNLALMEKAERRKVDEFLAMLAHELRNPLGPLRTGLQVLKHPGLDAARSLQVREMMERQVAVMTRLIDDLLDTARIAQGKIELRWETVDLNATVMRVANAAQIYFDARNQEFSLQLPSQPVYLQADGTRLEQILSNLLHNASKFTQPRGRISLEAAVERVDQPESAAQVRVSVRDNGMGMDADTLPRVFELFTQAERSLDRAQGGLGIGLTLARRLAELHGGTLVAHSAGLSQGSEFLLRLPITEKLPEGSPAPGAKEQPQAVRRVLIVEDNADTAASLEIALSLAGHSVRVAHDGVAATEAALQFRPEIVVCDIGLPGMSGYEVARKLRGNPQTSHALLVAVTGYGKDEDRRLAVEAGFDHHLTKPVDIEELLRIFARPLAQSETK